MLAIFAAEMIQLFKPLKHLLKLISLLLISQNIFSQESENKNASYHKFSILMSNTHIPDGIKEGGNKWLILSSWGLDYDYGFNSNWAIGIHTDIVLENYEVRSLDSEVKEIERSYPITISSVVLYKPKEHLSFILGPGVELAIEENLFLLLGGIEYAWELENAWEISMSITNEFKIDAYDSWAFGVGISKLIVR